MDNSASITGVLPHGYPFLMVDRVVEVVPGRRAVAIKNITGDCGWTGTDEGGSYPQLFLIEAMAQVGALAASGTGIGDPGMPAIPGYLAGLNDAKFGRMPETGDQVVFTLDYEAGMGGLVRFKGTAKIGEEMAAESGLTFSAPGRL